MHGLGLVVDLGRAAPDHHLAIGLRLELGDVVADLVGEVALVLADLLVLRGEALDVALLKGRGHGLDGFEEGPHALQLVAIKHSGGLGGVVEVAAEDVPAGEDEVVERSDGREVLDERGAVVGALAEADGAHLGHGADGLGEASANSFDAGDERGCDSAHSRDHDA